MLYSGALLTRDRVNVMSKKGNKNNSKAQPNNKKKKMTGVAEGAERQLKTWLIERRWGPGDRLPSEAQLCEMLGGISLISLKPAIKKLNAAGAIETIRGSGSLVRSDFAPYMLRDDSDLVIRLQPEEFHDMIEFRQMMDLSAVRLAAGRACAADQVVLAKAFNAMQASGSDPVKFSLAECDFHIAVAGATHNIIWIRAMKAIRGDYLAYLTELNEAGISEENKLAHEALYLSLKNQDPDAATRAMERVLAEASRASEAVKQRRAENRGTQLPIISGGKSSNK